MATMIVTAQPDPQHKDDAQAYVKQVLPMLQQAGGTLLKRLRVSQAVVGERTFDLSLVMEFERAETIEAFFQSPEYAAIAPHREKGFRFMNIVVTEDM